MLEVNTLEDRLQEEVLLVGLGLTGNCLLGFVREIQGKK